MAGLTPVLCIIGKKNAGKTGLTVSLAAEMNRRGWRIMTAKHGHGFQLDHPGKDSWRHRHEGGAVRTVLSGSGMRTWSLRRVSRPPPNRRSKSTDGKPTPLPSSIPMTRIRPGLWLW
jgi:molybdopterin-guanine dinucleotide biosynthesis protein